MAFPGGHGVFYRRVKGGSLGGERRKYLSDDPAQCGRDMMEQCIGGRLGSFFTQAESMDVTAARLSGTRQFTGRGRGQVGQLLHASKTGMLQTEFLSAPGKEQRRAADGARHHGAAPGSNYGRPQAVRCKNSRPGSVHGDNGTATSWSSEAGKMIRPAVGHGSGVDCGGHRRAVRATRAGRPSSKAAAEWGHDAGRHGVVPGAACGPDAGPRAP